MEGRRYAQSHWTPACAGERLLAQKEHAPIKCEVTNRERVGSGQAVFRAGGWIAVADLVIVAR